MAGANIDSFSGILRVYLKRYCSILLISAMVQTESRTLTKHEFLKHHRLTQSVAINAETR